MGKEKCPKCEGVSVNIIQSTDEETGDIIDDLFEAECEECGYKWLIAYLN